MKIFKNIKQGIVNYFKKRYIRKELKNKFLSKQKELNEYGLNKLNRLTESLFKTSKIVKNEMLEKERKKLEYENETLFNEMKRVIDKHYGEKEEILKNENLKLINELKKKDKTIKQIKEKISVITTNN